MADPIREAIRYAKQSAKLGARTERLEEALREIEQESQEHEAERERVISSALAACADSVEWWRLYKQLQDIDSEWIIADISLPYPCDGSDPWAYQRQTA